MEESLPYKAEYAKSSRASCRSCKSAIGKDTLRLAVMFQSPMFDGKVPHWYHMMCFFGKQRPKSVGDIEHYESLRYDDQQKIKEKIESFGAGSVVVPEKKGKKRAGESASNNGALKDFLVEYSKSSRATCRGCEQKIMKDEVRISKKDFESDVGKRYGGQDMWHHLECFAKLRSELLYYESGDLLPGFKSLRKDDQDKVKTQLPAIKQEDVPIKKAKTEDEVDSAADAKLEKEIKKQSVTMFKYRDQLKTELAKKELQNLLEYNDQKIPSGEETMLDRLCDIMTFGALEPCTVCKNGQFVFEQGAYKCNGDLTDWSKCTEAVKEPKRKPFQVPSDLKEKFSFLNKYKYKSQIRVFKYVPPTVSNIKVKKDDEDTGPKVQRARPALSDMVFVLTGFKPKERSALTKEIKKWGGIVEKEIGAARNLMAIIATKDELENEKNYHISTAKNLGIHIVSADFVTEAKDHAGKIPDLVLKKSICDWGDDPNKRLPPEPSVTKSNKSKSMFTKSVPKSITMKIKDGGAVEPESGLENVAHIYQQGEDKYNVVLGLTDIQKVGSPFGMASGMPTGPGLGGGIPGAGAGAGGGGVGTGAGVGAMLGPGMGSTGLPLNMFSANFNTAQLLQQMELATMGIGMDMNPFLMQSLLNSAGMGIPAAMPWMNQQISAKTVSNMWMNHDPSKLAVAAPQEEEEVDDEEMGVAETYADYMPSKLKLGRKHPDPVVETASLSSVSPVDVWYQLSIPEETIKSGTLSALQLESITYASQQHEHILPDGSRAGFLIGDGAGVGKGRTIAGIIFENYLKGHKRAVWVSVSNDLKYDAERDLRDIGAGKIDVHSLNKFKYAKISSAINGNVKKGVIFSTYSALIGESNSTGGKYKSRLKQLLQWCGEDFDGPIVFDECHRAKNLCPVGSSKPTKTGLTVLELQNKLPKARVVYASATGASEPRNMAYMVRLGIWGQGTPFSDFNDFIGAVEKRGVGAMEIVAMDMKLRGMYIARQLSFHGVGFKIEEVPLTKDFIKVYDNSVRLWVEAMQKFQEAAELIDAENRMKKTMWGQFWSSHQRFFKSLCIAAKVQHAVVVAREAVKCGKCVVIGLQSTGEARTLEQLERDDGELSDFVSTAKGVLQSLVEKHFPAPDRNRIQSLLGLEPPKNKLFGTNGDDSASSTTGSKRKPMRQAAARSLKRARGRASRSSDSDVVDSDLENRSSGSEYKMSGTDGDPWVSGRKKKGKKKHKKSTKRPSTQDKISMLLAKKSSERKTNGTSINNTGGPGVLGGYNQSPMAAAAGGGAPPRDAIERACSMKEELLIHIEKLGEKLPPNTLDQLIDELGGPENVAEMTGRKGRVVQTEDGIQYESRSEVDVPLETLNLTEKQRFMNGEKDVAIISEAASSGISLQSDRRALNQKRRVHITLELPWSADRAIQQFGRTHRSNQVNAPEYIFLISDLAGERRFASIVAKRLESLGALTHGDRRATETRDLSQFNIDNKYGRAALEATMKTIMKYEPPLVPPPSDYAGDFFKDVADALVGVGLIVNSEHMPGVLSLDKDYNNMSKFLNRILGMPVDLQNRLFQYFTDTLNANIGQAKRLGRFDMGILDLGTAGENVKRVKLYTFLRKHATGTAPTELHQVQVERGTSWDEAMDKWASLIGSHEGFYLSHQVRNGKHIAILAVAINVTGSSTVTQTTNKSSSKSGSKESKKDQMYNIYRPNTGLQIRQESLVELEKKYKKVSTDEATQAWKQQYEASVTTCSHAYWCGNCRNMAVGGDCEFGLRRRSYNILAGSVLVVWTRVEGILASKSQSNNKMQVVRLRTEDGVKIVGTLIPKNCVEELIEALSSDAESTKEQTF